MPNYPQPDRTVFEETGKTRRVGFEIEFAGLELEAVADLVADTLDGKVEKLTETECDVTVPDLGLFHTELDWQFGKKVARERLKTRKQEEGVDSPDDPLMSWVSSAAAQVVPVEIVCPPIPMDGLEVLDPLIEGLREAGAKGTHASPVYAFGVHVNPELPDLKHQTIERYLKAFVLCQDWLVKANKVDLSRRITPYIDLFPDDYIEALLAEETDSIQSLMQTYLAHNPTRNRALDMTPLFRHLDEEYLVAWLDDERIKARPTFHYRMPNSSPETPGWYLSDCWRPWCVIEQLAQDEMKLAEFADAWQVYHAKTLHLNDPPWFEQLEEWLADLSSE